MRLVWVSCVDCLFDLVWFAIMVLAWMLAFVGLRVSVGWCGYVILLSGMAVDGFSLVLWLVGFSCYYLLWLLLMLYYCGVARVWFR